MRWDVRDTKVSILLNKKAFVKNEPHHEELSRLVESYSLEEFALKRM